MLDVRPRGDARGDARVEAWGGGGHAGAAVGSAWDFGKAPVAGLVCVFGHRGAIGVDQEGVDARFDESDI